MEIIGYLDTIKDGLVKGWATQKGIPDPLDILIIVNGKQIKKKADVQRIGLKEKGIHLTGKCAFCVDISDLLPENGTEILVRVLACGKELKGSPKIYQLKKETLTKLNKVALIHIPKTAGTSINAIFEERYGIENVVTHLESDHSKKDPDILSKFDFVSGHLNFGAMRNLTKEYFNLAVIFREPIDQLISHINWVINISNDPSSQFFQNHTETIKKLSLQLRDLNFSDSKEIINFFSNLEGPALNLFDNCQSRYLLNRHKRGEKFSDADFKVAKLNLRKIDFLGFTEQLSMFVRELNARLNLGLQVEVGKKNARVGESVISRDELSGVLEPLIFFDKLLIREANQLVDKR